MRRAPGLVELSRREFCAFASAAIALVGCTSNGPGAIQTGNLTGSDGDDGSPDANNQHDDGGTTHDDGGTAASCPASGVTDVGAPATFVLNTPVYVAAQKMFVVRDSGGLYALTAVCTHEGATCDISGSDIHCPRHGALFTFNGAIISGPVLLPLAHYEMCTLTNGHVGVVTATKVAASQRLVA